MLVFYKLNEKNSIKLLNITLNENKPIFYLNCKINLLTWPQKNYKLPFIKNEKKFDSFIMQYF